MLIPAMKTATADRRMTNQEPEPICISAPRMMIEEIALVTAISGVCSACDTFQITWKPMKTDNTKTNEVLHEGRRGDKPHRRSSTAPTASKVT